MRLAKRKAPPGEGNWQGRRVRGDNQEGGAYREGLPFRFHTGETEPQFRDRASRGAGGVP